MLHFHSLDFKTNERSYEPQFLSEMDPINHTLPEYPRGTKYNMLKMLSILVILSLLALNCAFIVPYRHHGGSSLCSLRKNICLSGVMGTIKYSRECPSLRLAMSSRSDVDDEGGENVSEEYEDEKEDDGMDDVGGVAEAEAEVEAEGEGEGEGEESELSETERAIKNREDELRKELKELEDALRHERRELLRTKDKVSESGKTGFFMVQAQVIRTRTRTRTRTLIATLTLTLTLTLLSGVGVPQAKGCGAEESG